MLDRGRLQPSIERQHGGIDYYITQFLSGHGYFTCHLCRIGKLASSECLYCGNGSDDTKRTFLPTLKWESQRRELMEKLRPLSLDTLWSRRGADL